MKPLRWSLDGCVSGGCRLSSRWRQASRWRGGGAQGGGREVGGGRVVGGGGCCTSSSIPLKRIATDQVGSLKISRSSSLGSGMGDN